MKHKVTYLLFFLFFVSFSHPFKIIKCLTSKKKSRGFCRAESECVGANETLLVSKNCPKNLICCPMRLVSRKKCYEYSKSVFTKSLYTFPGQKERKMVDNCRIISGPFIVGGDRAFSKEFPHMVALGYKKNKSSEITWDCGGSLISELFVITTAHCCSGWKPPRVVKLGAVNLNSMDVYTQLRKVRKVIIHPMYIQKTDISYDIAILKMNKKVNFTPFVRPICLDYKGGSRHKRVFAIGYRDTSYGKKGKHELLKFTWNILDKETCKLRWKNAYKDDFPGNMFCAGSVYDGSETCSRNSGGSIQVILEKPYCMFSQIALSSVGAFCGYNYSVYLHSRVFSYVPWIESIVWPKEN